MACFGRQVGEAWQSLNCTRDMAVRVRQARLRGDDFTMYSTASSSDPSEPRVLSNPQEDGFLNKRHVRTHMCVHAHMCVVQVLLPPSFGCAPHKPQGKGHLFRLAGKHRLRYSGIESPANRGLPLPPATIALRKL